jgi:hypothetical protein
LDASDVAVDTMPTKQTDGESERETQMTDIAISKHNDMELGRAWSLHRNNFTTEIRYKNNMQ